MRLQHALVAAFCCMMCMVSGGSILWLDATSHLATARFAATGAELEHGVDANILACPGGSLKACMEMCPTSAHSHNQLHMSCVNNCETKCPKPVSVSDSSGNRDLALYVQRLGEANSTRTKLSYQRTASDQYVSELPVSAPFLLEASAALVKDRVLVQFWANADRVQKPNDWFDVQDAAQSALEVTLRDPYMKQTNHSALDQLLLRPTGNNIDQCERGERWNSNDACFIAVVRFNQSLLGLDVNLTTYSEGKELRTAFIPASALGVAIIRVPISKDNTTYAVVSYKEPKSGTYAGEPFDHVLHWATTSTQLNR